MQFTSMTAPTRVRGDAGEEQRQQKQEDQQGEEACVSPRRNTRPRPRHSLTSSSSPLPKRLRLRLEESAKRHERGEETRGDIQARLAAAEKKRQVREGPVSGVFFFFFCFFHASQPFYLCFHFGEGLDDVHIFFPRVASFLAIARGAVPSRPIRRIIKRDSARVSPASETGKRCKQPLHFMHSQVHTSKRKRN